MRTAHRDRQRLFDLQVIPEPRDVAVGEQIARDVQRVQVRVLKHDGGPTNAVLRRLASHLQTCRTWRRLSGRDRQDGTALSRSLKTREMFEDFVRARARVSTSPTTKKIMFCGT